MTVAREDIDMLREEIMVLQTLFLSLANALNRSDPKLRRAMCEMFEHAEVLLTARLIDQKRNSRTKSSLNSLRILETMREAVFSD
jgi:hypothetical protein